jgi:spore maturation protein CgeB
MLLGVGLGYELDLILEYCPQAKQIFAYERYPEVLRLALSLRDYSREIVSRKLIFLLGSDLMDRSWKDLPLLLLHPVLGSVYKEESLWFDKFSWNRSSNVKCLVNTRGLLARDVIETFFDIGANAFPLDVLALSPEETTVQIKEVSPDFVMTINYVKGLAELCAKIGVPLVVWEIDPTLEILFQEDVGTNGIDGNTFVYTYRKKRVDYFKSLGFKNVSFLPLAANTRKYRPMGLDSYQTEKYGADVSYVGSSMHVQGKWALEKIFQLLKAQSCPDSLEKSLKDALNRQITNTEVFYFPKFVETILSRMKCPTVIPDEAGRKIDVILALSEKIASFRRFKAVNTLEKLAAQHIVRVWGDEGWKEGLAKSIIYSGLAGHYHEIPIIYNASRINLDINRIYQKDIVPLRVFDILACGAFVLADDSKELGNFFKKGEEVISYKKISQIPSICAYYLRNDLERKEIASKGRKRVLREHSLEQRLSVMIYDVKGGLPKRKGDHP